MDQLAEITNNIYDAGILGKEGLMTSPSTILMSLMVTMLPKLVPYIMPQIIMRVNPKSAARFEDGTYDPYEMETMFRDKFVQNLVMVNDILNEEAAGEVRERKGEEGRLATLITSTLDTVGVDVSEFDGSKMLDMADLVSGRSPRSAMYNLVADTIINIGVNLVGYFF